MAGKRSNSKRSSKEDSDPEIDRKRTKKAKIESKYCEASSDDEFAKKHLQFSSSEDEESPSQRKENGRKRGRDSPPDSPTKKDSGKDAFYDDDSESDEDRIDYRIEHILGRRTMTAMEWTAVTDNMITREITKGSVLQQPDDEYFDQSKAPVEKFLIKWVHASYLHVSWETEKDLVDLVGKGVKHSIKKYLQREAEGRELFEDLSNGEYFPSSYIQIERVLDVDDKDVVVATIDWENVPLRLAKDFVVEEEPVKEVPVQVEVKSDSESDDLLESARNDEQTTPWSFEDSDSGAESPFAELDRKKVQRKTVRRINYTENSEDELELIDLVDDDEVDEEYNEEAEERKPAKKAPKPKKPKEAKKKPIKKKVAKKVKNQALHGDNCWVTVKWEGLSYSEVSFESLNDIIRFNIDYETQLRSFFKREQAPPKEELQGPRKMTLDHKVLGSTVEAPSFPGGVLRDYQWEGVRWMLFNLLQGRNSILADEMGLGKTIQSSTLLHMLKKHQTNAGPFLVVAPLSTIVNWQREVRAWTNLDAIMYYGSQEDRELIRSYEFNFLDKKKKGYKVEVVITTPETCVATDDKNGGRMKRVLSKIGWDLIIVDEAHKLKNYDSKLSSTLREEFYYRNCVLLTGTPLQNNTEELWTLLNFVGPSDFALKDEFMEKFGDLKSSAQLEELHNLIKPYLLRREKENVEKTVPPKQEMVIEVELTVPQKQYYRAIFEQKTGFLYKASMKDGPSLTNLAMELRKCCNHPYLIKGAPVELAKHFKEDSHMDILIKSSGKMTLLAKLLPKLQKDGHRVLIFSQFRMMLDIIEDYVHNAGFMYERVDGSIVGKKRQAAIDRYTENNKIFVMLLSTKAGGVGINLTAADTVIIYDSDWNPQNDIQAQARAHRIGQTRSVTVYRLLTKKTYEMAMFRAASIKLGLDYAVMHNLNQSTATLQSAHAKMRGSTTALAGISSERADTASALSRRELENLLKHGAYDIFLEEKEGKSETESTMFVEESIEQILERSSVFLHQQNDSEMQCMKTSSFAKASFISAGTADAASEEVAIDDPDFWSKVVGLSVEDQAIAMGAKRKCRQSVDSYKEPSMSIKSIYGDRQSAYVTDSDDNSVDSQGNKRSSKRRKKPEQPEIVPADYTVDNLASILTAMVNHGYGEWDSIRRASKLWWNDADIATACTYNVLGCLMYSAVVVDKAATATAKDGTGGSANADGDAQIQVAEEATPNADEATSTVTAAAKEDSIKFDLTLAKSLLRRYKVCKLATAVYLSCATAMSPAASQEDYLLSQVVRSLIEYSNIEQRSTLQMRRHFTSALVALVKATESSEDDEDSSVALSAWMTKVADSFPTSTLGTEIYSLGEETDVGKVQKKVSMAKSKLAQLDDLFEARVYSKLAKQMVSADTENLAPSSSAEGAIDVDGEDEARLLASPSVNVLKQLTKTSEDEDAADQFWSVEHDHSLLLAAAAYGFPDSKKRYFRIMEEISVKHGIEYSSTVPVSAPSTTSPTDGEQSATTATTAVEGGDGAGAASTSQPVNNGIHEKYTPKFLSTRLRAVGRMLRCTEEDLQAVAKREAQVEKAKAQAEKALLAAKNAEKNLRKKNVTQVLKTAQRIGYPRSIYPVLLENLRGALGAESPALASRAEYLLSWESFHTACEVGQMDMETTREVVQQAIAHTNQSPEEATEPAGLLEEITFKIADTFEHADVIHHIRILLALHSEEDLSQLIKTSCKIAGPDVPTFRRDTSIPVWWTLAHDLSLLKLCLQIGYGAWKKIVADPIVSNVPADFEMPPKINGADWCVALTPKNAEKRVQSLLRGLPAMRSLSLPTPTSPQRKSAASNTAKSNVTLTSSWFRAASSTSSTTAPSSSPSNAAAVAMATLVPSETSVPSTAASTVASEGLPAGAAAVTATIEDSKVTEPVVDLSSATRNEPVVIVKAAAPFVTPAKATPSSAVEIDLVDDDKPVCTPSVSSSVAVITPSTEAIFAEDDKTSAVAEDEKNKMELAETTTASPPATTTTKNKPPKTQSLVQQKKEKKAEKQKATENHGNKSILSFFKKA